jgi:hypothetical protein
MLHAFETTVEHIREQDAQEMAGSYCTVHVSPAGLRKQAPT